MILSKSIGVNSKAQLLTWWAVTAAMLTSSWYGQIAADEDSQSIVLAQSIVRRLSKGDLEKILESFDATMKLALPVATLKQNWLATTEQFGEFQKTEGTRTEDVMKFKVVFVTMVFERGKLDCKVVVDAENRVAGLFFVPSGKYAPPTYVKRDSFNEKEIQVGKGFFPLMGTLTTPVGDGPFPAVLLVHGSGPHDRDETIGPNKPFRDLAQGLASRGIAALRYEKRTKQYATMMALTSGNLTVQEETVNDAAAAVETLLGQAKIDPKRVFVLGHSLGGMLLPRIAAATGKPAGFISLAGSTRPMEDLILEQTKYIVSIDGKLTAEEEEALTKIEQQVTVVKSTDLSPKTPAADLPLGVPAKYWLDLRDYRPAEAAAKITKPLLFLQGERDYQVTLVDFAGWRKALEQRKDVKFISYPRLNHLFMDGGQADEFNANPKSTPLEYFTAGNVAEPVVTDIADWITSN